MENFPALSSTSMLREKWQFDEESPIPGRYFLESFEGYELEGRILPIVEEKFGWPHLLAIHGARSDYTRINPLLYLLQTHGIASLSFNLSGHNNASAVGIEQTSLGNNLREALRFAKFLGNDLHTIFGHSMGGALALKVAEAHRSQVKKIVLSCPALYSEAAYHRPFGNPFRDEISKPFGFSDSLSLNFLREFEGELLLIIGQYDGLKSEEENGIAGKSAGMINIADDQLGIRKVNSAIPFEVVDAIEKSLTADRFRKIVVPGCDHALSAWLRANPVYASGLAREVAGFLRAEPLPQNP